VIARRQRLPPLRPFVQVGQLGAQDRRLDRVDHQRGGIRSADSSTVCQHFAALAPLVLKAEARPSRRKRQARAGAQLCITRMRGDHRRLEDAEGSAVRGHRPTGV